jgi:mRNA interferase MazF
MGATDRQRGLVEAPPYQPDAGDIAFVSFDPQAGKEQGKNRPALVLTERLWNVTTGLLVACPITSTRKGWGSHIPLYGGLTTGFIMTEQVKSLDWQARGARFVERSPRDILESARNALAVILGLP